MEQSNNIEKTLTPVRLRGRNIYRCPFCRKKFERKCKAMDHIRSVHLQLKKLCDNCKKNVSFVSYNRHLRACVARKSTQCDRITSSSTQSKWKNVHQRQADKRVNVNEVRKSRSQSIVAAKSLSCTSTRNISIGSPTFSGRCAQSTNAGINEIAQVWTYQRPAEDELEIFGNFIAMEMRVLTRNDQFSLKRRIQQLLLEYEPADEIIEANDEYANITVGTEMTDRNMSSNLGFSNELGNEAVTTNCDDDDDQSLLTPKREIIDGESVLKSFSCSLCDRDRADIFHDEVAAECQVVESPSTNIIIRGLNNIVVKSISVPRK